jgi:O-antigen/teichoic acid export membrane protein
MTRIGRNVAWNALFLVLQAVGSLAVVPLLLRATGEESFGTYTFLLSFVALAQLAQGGVILAVARAVAEHTETADRDRLQAAVSFAYTLATGAGAVLAIVMGVVSIFPAAWNVSDATELRQLGVILAASLWLNTTLAVARGALVGVERFLARNLFETLPSVVAVAAALAIALDVVAGDIVTYALIVEAARCTGGVFALGVAKRSVPGIDHRPRAGRPPAGIMSFHVKQTANQAADVLFFTTDRMILQVVAGSVVVAHYAVADRPHVLATSILSVPLMAVVPPLVAAIARSDAAYLNRAMSDGSIHYCAATLPPLIAIFAFAPALVELWVGPGFDDSALAARWFIAGLIVAAPFKMYSHYRVAEGSIGAMSLVKLAYAPVNAGLSYLLAGRIGILGVVIPTVTFYVVILPTTWLVSMRRRDELARFGRTLLPISAATAVALGGAIALSLTVDRLAGVQTLLITAAVAGAAYVVFAAFDSPLLAGVTQRLRAGIH